MANPVISIVVPVVDQPDVTIRCFHGVRLFTKLPFELIWVDNGSTKESRRLIARQADQFKGRCHLIRNDTNEGFIKATNKGIRAARGEYIILLNNDTEVFPGWETKLIKPLYHYDDVGAVGPITQSGISWQTNRYLNHRWEIGLPPYNESIKLEYWKKLKKKFEDKYLDVTGMPLSFFCTAMHRSLVDDIGLLCEEMNIGLGDDDEFCMRMRMHGYKQWLSLGTFVYHSHRTTFRALNLGVESLHSYNMQILKKKEKELQKKLQQ
jgi:GT2 family glycosyltransferase